MALGGIMAPVKDGKLEYDYTDKKAEEAKAKGSDLGYDQFLQLLCAEMQYQDPLEPTSNTDYVAQLATFSQLEASLAQTETLQGDMANNLVGKEVIMKVEDDKGKKTFVEGTVDYVMYQDGEIYLSINDGLYPLTDLDTVADSKYYDAVALAKTFTSMVGAFPDKDNVTAAYKGAVDEVRELYDGMTDYEKHFIDEETLNAFVTIETRVNELYNAEQAQKGETDKTEGTGNTEGTDKTEETGSTEGTGSEEGTDNTEESDQTEKEE